MQDVLHLLFDKFPRYVGNPLQSIVNSFNEFKYYIDINNGFNECFTSLFSFDINKKPIIDKAFFDLDYGTLEETLKAGQKKFEYCTETLNQPTVPTWSGVRGSHIYPLFKPKVYDEAAILLKKYSYHVILETETYKIDKDDGKYIPYADPRVIGDVRRLCRIPNTRRINSSRISIGKWCIPLDPERYLDMDIKEVMDLIKKPNYNIRYNFDEPTSTLDEYNDVDIDMDNFKSVYNFNKHDYEEGELSSRSVHVYWLKKLIKRPCIYKLLVTSNPPDFVRLAAVIQLKVQGISKKRVLLYFSALNWFDWDEMISDYHISSIYAKENIKPVSRKKMEEYGLCENCNICSNYYR
jgi:hypothetical protein